MSNNRKPFDDLGFVTAVRTHGSVLKACKALGIVSRRAERRIAESPRLRERVAQARAEHQAAQPFPHGIAGYKRGCRCDDCRAANAASKARWMAKVAGHVPEHVPHSRYAYSAYSCRCDVCTADHTAMCRDNYHKRRNRASTPRTPPRSCSRCGITTTTPGLCADCRDQAA